jgi:ribose 5-phosphate isomerase B
MPILRIAVGADDRNHLSDFVVEHLKALGIELELYGALDPGADSAWPVVAEEVGLRVASGECSQGVVMCWTGTGVSIAANKVPGVRAALCGDAETALGARAYNDANVLCLSLRATSEAVAKEILDAWFAAGIDEGERANIQRVKDMDRLKVS